MKKSLLLIFALLCMLSTTAQERLKFFDSRIADHSVVFGIRGGLNFGGLGADIKRVWDTPLKSKSDNGWNIGVIVDCPILKSLYFQPGVFFKTRGFKLSESDKSFSRQIHGKANYVVFPLLLSYRFNVKPGLQFEFNLGPYIGIGISGKVMDYSYPKDGGTPTIPGMDSGSMGEDPTVVQRDYFGDDLETSLGMKKSDTGVCFGVGMTVNRFYIGFQYDLGLANLCNDVCWGNDVKFRNRSATVLIGFNINKN